MKGTPGRIRLCTCLVILNLAFIWGNSLLPGAISGQISDWVKNLLFGASESTGGAGSFLVRKLGHFTEFTALGLSLGWLFAMGKKRIHTPLLLGIAAACVDESIQLLVPDRGPSLWDVALDSTGVLAGILLLHLGHTYYRKKTSTN